MCLTMTVQLKKPLGDGISRIPATGVLSIIEHRNWRRKPTGLLTISEPSEGCACSMLTEDADWGRPHWDMRPEVLPQIAKTLDAIHQQVPEGFEFEALWIGDEPDGTEAVTIEEMRSLILAGQIGQKVRYVIKSRPRHRA
jgi:hypothetical protein